MAFGMKWVTHLTTFTYGMLSDNNGQCSNIIRFKVDPGADATIIHGVNISHLQYSPSPATNAESIGGIVAIKTVTDLNLILEFRDSSHKPRRYSLPLALPHPDVPYLLAVDPGQIKSLEPINPKTKIPMEKISILGANVIMAFEMFFGLLIHKNVVIFERPLLPTERNTLLQVPRADYPDPLLPSYT